MKITKVRLFEFLSVFLIFFLSPTVAYADGVKCTRVIDGDTIVVYYNGKLEKVRLIGVDTPETVHPQSLLNILARRRQALPGLWLRESL